MYTFAPNTTVRSMHPNSVNPIPTLHSRIRMDEQQHILVPGCEWSCTAHLIEVIHEHLSHLVDGDSGVDGALESQFSHQVWEEPQVRHIRVGQQHCINLMEVPICKCRGGERKESKLHHAFYLQQMERERSGKSYGCKRNHFRMLP